MTHFNARPQATTVTVGGHTYRVTSTADAEELARLAQLVDDRLLALPVSQRGDPKSLVLVALALAHDLEHERQANTVLRQQTANRVCDLVAQIDEALGHVDLDGNPLVAPGTRAVATVASAQPEGLSTSEEMRVRTGSPRALSKHRNIPQ